MTSSSAKNQATFLLRYALQTLGIVVIVAVVLRLMVVSSYVMSGSSMLPNIWPGDFLIGQRWHAVNLSRNEVVIVRCPSSSRICMKRVVAVEGDRVEFKKGKLHVNGFEVKQSPLGSDFVVESIMGRSRSIWPDVSQTIEDVKPIIVPPQHVYLLNDKRSDREDSRAWGPVPLAQVEARAGLIWLSLDWTDGEQVRSWPAVRWNRFFRTVN